MIKTGIFGGSFNPIHNGHIALARQILQQSDLDEIWFVVSPQNPMKSAESLANDETRLMLVRAALEEGKSRDDGKKIVASDYEFKMPRPSYMYDTLTAMRAEYPERLFTLLIGGDNWVRFRHWYRWEDILRDFRIIIYPREGSMIDKDELPQNVEIVETQLYDISSTEIREKISKGEDISHLVPQAVANYYK